MGKALGSKRLMATFFIFHDSHIARGAIYSPALAVMREPTPEPGLRQ